MTLVSNMAQPAQKMPQPGTVRSITTGMSAVMSISTVFTRFICQTFIDSLLSHLVIYRLTICKILQAS